MARLFEKLKWIVLVVAALGAGTLPSCGSMGGKYLVEPPSQVAGYLDA